MATYKPLSTDFKDDILASQNSKRKYTQVNNPDGTVSFQDSTAYSQVGSSYGAKEVNEEREAINNIYANKLVTLDEIDLVTEPGFFVDAQVVKELNSKSIIAQSGIDWIVERHGNYFEAYGVYSGYVSASKLYAIDVPLPFTVDSLTVAFVNPSYHAYYLNKWYINEAQTYSKSKLNLCFQTVNISSQTDFKFDLFIAGRCIAGS